MELCYCVVASCKKQRVVGLIVYSLFRDVILGRRLK